MSHKKELWFCNICETGWQIWFDVYNVVVILFCYVGTGTYILQNSRRHFAVNIFAIIMIMKKDIKYGNLFVYLCTK